MRTLVTGAVAIVLAVATVLASGASGARASTLAAVASVEILDNAFSPAALSIVPGTTVTFANHGTRAHTVTASSPVGAFDSGYVMPGASWSFTFTSAGTFVYHCEIHTGMAGTITVVGGAPAPTGTTIDVTDYAFTPASLAVDPGTSVTWRNSGAVTHTVTSALFGAQRLAPGASFSYTFATAGLYAYVCDIHAGMAGTVSVGAPPPPTAPPPTSPPATPVPSPTGVPGTTAAVMIMGNAFTPATLTIDPGTTVTWTNHDAVAHTVTKDGVFDLTVRPGQSASYTFAAPGTYDYYCAVHAGMFGSVTVRGTPGASPSPSPSPSPTASPVLGGTVVNVGDNYFSPTGVSILPGATVTWHNVGARRHTVTGPTFGATLAPGESYTFTFAAAGGYRYQCDFHPEMSGVVFVAAAGAATPTLPPPPPVSTIAPAPSLPATAVTVSIADNSFSPAALTVATGTTVTWVHRGRAPHTVTANDGSFDATLGSGGTFAHTFTAPGTYAYLCQFHDGMTGTITVTGAARSASPTPSRSPSPTPTPTVRPAVPPTALTIVIGDNNFTPGTTRVPVGTTVAWVNHGRIRHTVTSLTSVFDSGIMSPDGVYSVTFDTPGTYPYVCDIHPGMRGTIEVFGSDGVAPPPAPAAAPPPSATPAPAVAGTTQIGIVDNAFEPKSVTVAAGTTLRWTNTGKAKHTVTFTSGATGTSELLGNGAVYETSFAAPGTYGYICALHPEMTGTITVTPAAAGAVATAVPTAAPAVVAPAPTAKAIAVAAPAPTRPSDVGTAWAWMLGIGLALIGAFGLGMPLIAARATSADERRAELRRRRGW